jgi:hypothetical protein
MKNSIIQEIYFNASETAKEFCNQSTEAEEKASEAYHLLLKRLSKNEQKELNEFLNLSLAEEAEREERIFSLAFRMGAQLVFELFSDKFPKP